MAAQDFDATGQPVDVIAALNLRHGTAYFGMNLSTVATLLIRSATTVPTSGARAFRVEPGGTFTLRPTGEAIYLWTDDPQGCAVLLDEAP